MLNKDGKEDKEERKWEKEERKWEKEEEDKAKPGLAEQGHEQVAGSPHPALSTTVRKRPSPPFKENNDGPDDDDDHNDDDQDHLNPPFGWVHC